MKTLGERVSLETNVREAAGSWAERSALLGAALWVGVAVLARIGIARIGGIELMFLFAPLVIVPLGMELGRGIVGEDFFERTARWGQLIGAMLAAWAVWLPPGRTAGTLAVGWFIVCLLMAGSGGLGLVRDPWRDADGGVRATLAVARVDLAVGGAWFVASRLGLRPLGIQEPIGMLTAVHFHFAGFATASIAAATLRFGQSRGQGSWLKWVVPVVVGMPFAVAAGFVISPALKMGAAVLFSASVALLAVFLRSYAGQVENGTARVLLQVAAASIFAGVVLAAVYAIADFGGRDVLPIPQMVRTHGILNGVGFCMCGLLGWLVANSRPA